MCIYIHLPFVLFAFHHILTSMTLHPVIALGSLQFSHTGEKNSGVYYNPQCLTPVTHFLEILVLRTLTVIAHLLHKYTSILG